MRPFLAVLAALGASTTTSLAVWVAISLDPAATSPPFCERLRGSLVRTNHADAEILSGIEEVLKALARGSDGRALPPCETTLDVWFTQADYLGNQQERTSRRSYRQAGVEGSALDVEVIRDTGAATLIFFRHRSPEVVERATLLLEQRLLGTVSSR